MKENFVSRQQVNLIPERLRKAEETNATKDLRDYIWNLSCKNDFNPLNILLVGAGGSYPAALFGKHALHENLRALNVEAVMPQTALRIFNQYDCILGYAQKPIYDLVIGVSYSGTSPDVHSVAKLCAKKGYPFVLLTGMEKSELIPIYKDIHICEIISYFNSEDITGREKGMISMFSTLAPAVIFNDLCEKSISDIQTAQFVNKQYVYTLDIPYIATLIKDNPIIHVFYEWDTLPTAADIKSKFTESGISNVILHEKKNFSHGCYTALYNQHFALVINLCRHGIALSLDGSGLSTYYQNRYDELLSKFLRNRCESSCAYYLEIGTAINVPTKWNIEALSLLPYLITAIGEELDIDISKPLKPFPKEAIELYNYKGNF